MLKCPECASKELEEVIVENHSEECELCDGTQILCLDCWKPQILCRCGAGGH